MENDRRTLSELLEDDLHCGCETEGDHGEPVHDCILNTGKCTHREMVLRLEALVRYYTTSPGIDPLSREMIRRILDGEEP